MLVDLPFLSQLSLRDHVGLCCLLLLQNQPELEQTAFGNIIIDYHKDYCVCVFSLSITKLFSMHGDISCITSRSERKLSESMSVSGSGIGAAAEDIGGIVDILDIGGREGSLAQCFKEPEDREARKPGFAWPCVVRSFSLLKMNKDGLGFSLYLHTSCRCQTSSPLTFMLLTNIRS